MRFHCFLWVFPCWQDYLKKVRCASRFIRFSFQSEMTINQQSFLVSNMCGEFMIWGGYCECGQTTYLSELFVVKAVWCSSKVSPHCMGFCEAIKKEAELDIPAFKIDIYLQEASLFCVANPLQVRMELATEIVLCFPILFAGWQLEQAGWRGCAGTRCFKALSSM